MFTCKKFIEVDINTMFFYEVYYLADYKNIKNQNH